MPEDQNIEWKASWRDEYLKWICGFANAQGGRVYIGMNDEGQVTGLKDYKQLLEDIPNKIVATLGIMPEVNLYALDGFYYIEINVAPSSVPVNYKGEYHYRCGSTKQQLKGAALTDFLMRKTGRRWDAQTIDNLSIESLDRMSFDIFRREAKRTGRLQESDLNAPASEILESLHLTDNGKLTRAAALLFYHEPDRILPGCYVRIGRFRKGYDLLYQDELRGSFIRLADETVQLLFIKYFKAAISYDNEVRVERYPYSRIAVREIFFNALVHSNWGDGQPIQIRVDDNRLIITNSCVLPLGWTVEQLTMYHPSRPFNPLIADTFFRSGFIERWGRGISTVFNICAEGGYPEPQFQLTGETMSVIFPIDPAYQEPCGDEKGQASVLPAADEKRVKPFNGSAATSRKLNELEKAIIAEIERDRRVTQVAMAKALKRSRSTIQRSINDLVRDGFIGRDGKSNGGAWVRLIR